jgi:hypothetical protein
MIVRIAVIIRREQMKIFEEAALQAFEDEMTWHLYEFSPRHAAVIGEENVRLTIRRGVARAGRYGLTHRGPVRLYLDLTFMFGSDFDTDPQLPWAAAILGSGAVDQMERAEQLHAGARWYSDAVAGPKFEYAKEAFARARRVRYEHLRIPPGEFEEGCLTHLRAVHPEKYAYVGREALTELIREGVGAAAHRHVSGEPEALFWILLMFAMGHGFASDPLFPWVSSTLDNPGLGTPNQRVEKLYSKTMVYLDGVLEKLR